jgi:hypothetical protein
MPIPVPVGPGIEIIWVAHTWPLFAMCAISTVAHRKLPDVCPHCERIVYRVRGPALGGTDLRLGWRGLRSGALLLQIGGSHSRYRINLLGEFGATTLDVLETLLHLLPGHVVRGPGRRWRFSCRYAGIVITFGFTQKLEQLLAVNLDSWFGRRLCGISLRPARR